MLCGTDNIMHDIPSFMLNVGFVLHNTASPTKHCYGFEECYIVALVTLNILNPHNNDGNPIRRHEMQYTTYKEVQMDGSKIRDHISKS